METSSKAKHAWWSVLFGFSLLSAVVWLFYYGVRAVFIWLGSVESQLAIAIIAGSLTATVSIVSLIVTKHLENRTAIEQEHRAKKIPVYEELIALFFRVIFAEKLGQKPLTDKELARDFVSLTQKLLVWASNDVISAYAKIRSGASKGDPQELIRIQEALFRAIRADLGHDAKRLPDGTLVSLFLNDDKNA